MLSDKREFIKPLVFSIAKHLQWLHPNLITLLGLLLSLILFYLLSNKMFIPALFAFALLPLDALDGAVAKIRGQQTKFGLFWDNTADRIADFVIILGFFYGGIIPLWMTFPAVLLTIMISYMRASLEVALGKRQILAKGLMQRTERLVLLAVILTVHIILPNLMINTLTIAQTLFLLLILASAYTFFFRIIEAKNILK